MDRIYPTTEGSLKTEITFSITLLYCYKIEVKTIFESTEIYNLTIILKYLKLSPLILVFNFAQHFKINCTIFLYSEFNFKCYPYS